MQWLIAYGATLVTFLVADMIWLGSMVSRLYRPAMGDIALQGFRLGPAAIFYLLYPIGIVLFAIQPALKSGSFVTATVYGALLGFFCYATYDLTNQATLKNWSTMLTVVDIAWGMTLGAIAATVGYLVAVRFGHPV